MMENKEERGRLFGAIIKGVLVGVTIFLIFGKVGDFKKKIDFGEENQTAELEEITKDITEDIFLEELDEPETNSNQEIFTVVETMPKFKGCENLEGDEATQCTIKKIQSYTSRVEYPQIAIDNDIDIEGKVYIRFVVDAKGKVSEVKLLRGVDDWLDNVALEHIKRMPKFASPGKQKGKPVKVQYSIPIVFKLG